MSVEAACAELLRWDTGATIAEASYARLRAHPKYGAAVRRFAANMLAAGDADPALDGVLKDAGRNLCALCTAYLHVTGGLTLPRLKALCAQFGLVSPGRVRALLLYMLYLGFLGRGTRGAGGGPAVYPATSRFLETWRRHQRAVLEAVVELEPAVALLLDRFDSPGVFETYTMHLGEGFVQSVSQTDVNMPYFRIFMHRHAGIQVVHALLAESGEGPFPPTAPIVLSQSSLARRFRVSRVHIQRMLTAASEAGLLKLHPTSEVQFEAAGRAALDYVFGTQIIRFLITAARTLVGRPDILAPVPQIEAPLMGSPTERGRPLSLA